MERNDNMSQPEVGYTIDHFMTDMENYIVPANPINSPSVDHPDLGMFRERFKCTDLGMFAVITQRLCMEIADWIGPRACLEVMAGAGWLARGLELEGVNIVATDSGNWAKENDWETFSIVRTYYARKALQRFGDRADILIVSWPPYTSSMITKLLPLWGSDKPILYIGEGPGGCCGDDKFFQVTQVVERPNWSFYAWPGIHDAPYILKYDPGGDNDWY